MVAWMEYAMCHRGVCIGTVGGNAGIQEKNAQMDEHPIFGAAHILCLAYWRQFVFPNDVRQCGVMWMFRRIGAFYACGLVCEKYGAVGACLGAFCNGSCQIHE